MASGSTGAPGNIPYPVGSDQYALTSDLAGMASQINLGLANARWDHGSLTAPADVDELASGTYSVWTVQDATNLGLPTETQGVLEVARYGDAGRVQVWRPRSNLIGPQIWQRHWLTSEWTAWVRMDAAEKQNWWYGASTLTEHADDLGSGVYTLWTGGTALSLGLPTETQGILESFRYGNTGGVQRWNTRSIDFPLEVWQRQRHSTVWDAWQRIDAGGIEIPAPGAGGSGFKTIPLAVTLGNSGTSDAPASQTVRYALHFNAQVTRWRVHVANRNSRSGSTRTGNIDFEAWQLGTEGAGGAIQSPVTVVPAFSTDGTGWVSQWITAPIGTNTPLLLGTSYTSTVPPILQVGACWSGATASTLTRQANAPFEVWIEAETPATTPVVAVLGSSSDAGVGGTRPVMDSTIARWARAHGALPVHYAHSGDAMSASLNPSAHKWTRWAHLDRPDSVLFALGSNDVYGSGTVAEMQDRHAQVAEIAAKVISPVQYGATVYQRANGEDPERTPYNTWLKGMPNGLRQVFDFSAAIGSPPNPAYDADGVHVNDAGHAALLAAITSPLTPADTDWSAAITALNAAAQ